MGLDRNRFSENPSRSTRGSTFYFHQWARDRRKTATVLEGIKGQLVAGVLSDSPDTAPEQAPKQSTSDNSHLTRASHPTTWLSARTAVPFSVGAAGLLTGAIFGFMALHDKAILDESCPDKRCLKTAAKATSMRCTRIHGLPTSDSA